MIAHAALAVVIPPDEIVVLLVSLVLINAACQVQCGLFALLLAEALNLFVVGGFVDVDLGGRRKLKKEGGIRDGIIVVIATGADGEEEVVQEGVVSVAFAVVDRTRLGMCGGTVVTRAGIEAPLGARFAFSRRGHRLGGSLRRSGGLRNGSIETIVGRCGKALEVDDSVDSFGDESPLDRSSVEGINASCFMLRGGRLLRREREGWLNDADIFAQNTFHRLRPFVRD